MTATGGSLASQHRASSDHVLPTGLLTGGVEAADLKVASCVLSPQYSAVGAARSFARRTVRRWRAENLADDLTLVVSELVANALHHGLGVRMAPGGASAGVQDAAAGTTRASSNPIELFLLCAGGRVMCAVNDPSAEVPVRKEPDPATGSGRGLQLIDSLSLFWGWTPVERDSRSAGKAVWAVLAPGDRHLPARTV